MIKGTYIVHRFILAMLAAMFCMQLTPVKAQKQSEKTRILFVLDCSGSMWGDMEGQQKIVVARQLLSEIADSLTNIPNVEMGLRAYGHTSKPPNKDCKDTRLEVPIAPSNGPQVKSKLAELKPSGTTPIAYSLTQAGGDFPNYNGKNILILITDGLEECDGDPCAVSQSLQSRNVILKPFIIGLGLKEDYSKQFECMGHYFSARTKSDFKNILSTVVTQALNNTTMQVNLNDIKGQPTETNVNMTFYDGRSGEIIENIYHTMNKAGRPDTLHADPLLSYNIVVHTTPVVVKNGVTVAPARHTIVNVPAPQGSLRLDVDSKGMYALRCIVRRNNQQEIIFVQDFNSLHQYLVGTYDLEVLSLPRIKIDNVKIDQSKESKIQIPRAGRLTLAYSKDVIASLYILRDNKQEWVIDIEGRKGVDNDSYFLQPGSYKLVYRSKKAYDTFDTKELDFKIGSTTSITYSLD